MVSKPLYYLFIVLLLTCCGQTISQNNEGDKIFGFTLSPLVPIDLLWLATVHNHVVWNPEIVSEEQCNLKNCLC